MITSIIIIMYSIIITIIMYSMMIMIIIIR